MVAPNSDWPDASQSGDDGERGHGLLTGSRVEQLAGDGRRCGEGAEKGRAERREWWRHGHSRAERGRTERRPQGRSGTRPWRELRGWLLRSAREPDPWRLGSGRTTEGKGAGQSGRERLGLITQWSGIRTEPGRSRRWLSSRPRSPRRRSHVLCARCAGCCAEEGGPDGAGPTWRRNVRVRACRVGHWQAGPVSR